MSPEDMASNARKSENAQIRKEALKESERGQHLKKVCRVERILSWVVAVSAWSYHPAGVRSGAWSLICCLAEKVP
jgi:hypothetical protein